ncbi:MAG: TolC family protein [Planctomycetes bacterium]|nr:TolC family protein [Planctomycetota bacterium]MBL7143123.1 TolC family protein [Phycisphaerae bacterium]
MCIRYLLLVMLFALVVSGCMEQSSDVTLTKQQSLGQEFITFQPPAKPVENPDVPEISEPTGPITLREALALALLHNPELKVFSWDIRVSEAKRLQASLLPNPKLEVETEEVGGPGQRNDFDGAETTIQLSQLIELGDKRSKRTKLASLEKELAGWDYEAKRLDVFTEVAKAFAEVLAAQQGLELTQELLRVSEELLDTVTQRVDAGKDSPLEKTKAMVALSNIKIQHQQAIQYLEFTRKQLAATWTGTKPKFKSAAGRLDSLSPIPSIEELTSLIEQNPDIARWLLEIEKEKAALELEKAKAISDITLKGGIQRFNETDDNAILFGISIPLPISDKNQAGKLRARYELAKAGEEQRAAYIRVQMKLARAYQALSSAYTEATELEKNVLQGAEGVFEASRTGYEQGKLDYLNVLDAQRTLFEAKGRYIDALASYHAAKADVERLIGCSIDSETLSKSEDTK